MQSFTKPTRVALITGAAGAALIGAVALGGAASAAGPAPAPSASGSASAAPGAPAREDAKRHQPRIGGAVLTVNGSTITVQDREGFTRTITLADGATVTKDGASAQTSAIVVGAHIEATGSVAADKTTLSATTVAIGQPAGPAGGPGRGGPGPEGRGPKGTPPTPGTEGAAPAPSAPAPGASAPAAPTASATTSGS